MPYGMPKPLPHVVRRQSMFSLMPVGPAGSAVGELVTRLGQAQPKVSNHLACLRSGGFVATRREHPTVFYRVADPRVEQLLELARGLLADNAEHVAACGRIDGKGC